MVTPRAHAPHETISAVHVLALVRGLAEEATEPRTDRYRYFKSLLGAELHETAAIRCGLTEHTDGDLRATADGLDLYEPHLRHLPDMAANYWHDQPHAVTAVTEINHIYDRAATDTPNLTTSGPLVRHGGPQPEGDTAMAADAREWAGATEDRYDLHRFDEDRQARCNLAIRTYSRITDHDEFPSRT
ncbi:hypothetical protein [Streptomyces californicus]|uniref:hypothetical protein n=1 Tax=Streptomyces californicus TaxID=67351 RepID=UPI0037B90116